MALQQQLEQSQRLLLTQTMLQSLEILQMPVSELQSYLEEAALSNPLLDVERPHAPNVTAIEFQREREIALLNQQAVFSQGDEEPADFTAFFSRPKSFTEYLREQLGQIKALDRETMARCLFIIDSLSTTGYLDCPLEELAKDTGQSLFDIEQALYVVQALDPIGVGARSLSECLLLQLSAGCHFTELNIHLIRFGLPLLAKRDMRGLCALLHAPIGKVQQAVEIIRGLNPIPSQGFVTEETTGYVQPEAIIRREGEKLFVDMNDHALPRVRIDPMYCSMIDAEEFREAKDYLQKKQTEAKSLLANLDSRNRTISRVICAVVQVQREYFLHDAPLCPLTMQQLADQLELNVSTVSRTVKGKYIQFEARVFPVRDLLTAALQASDGGNVSVDAAKQQIRRFISTENPQSPLSDEVLSQALVSIGIPLSRRTVAKYRMEMGIPAAGVRKNQLQYQKHKAGPSA